MFGLGSISPERRGLRPCAHARASSRHEQQIVRRRDRRLAVRHAGRSGRTSRSASNIAAKRPQDVPDVLTQAGLNAGNAEAPTFGDYDVEEAFVGVDVPLLRRPDRRCTSSSVGGAYRYSDYSTVGTHQRVRRTPLLGADRVTAVPRRSTRTRCVRRTSASCSRRAARTSRRWPIPANGVTATSAGTVDDNCRASPAVAARIAATGTFTLTQPEIQGTGGFTGVGNPDLEPRLRTATPSASCSTTTSAARWATSRLSVD